jgi:small ligand-binding sensory domain FIST
MGGLVSGARGPGLSRLFCDDRVLESGAVGLRLPGWRGVRVVSQGCRPIGEPYTVTGARGRVITGLGGRPPLWRLQEMVAGLPAAQQALVAQGLLIGIAVDEYDDVPARGDFLIRTVIGADEAGGAIEVGDVVEVGTIVQFQVRDAAGADDDLRIALRQASAAASGRPAGGLLFTCNGRGRRLFGVPDHDAKLVEDLLGDIPLAGFFAAGELGPIGSRNAVHGFTASLALFLDEPGR